jgi:excisionase family DNA binding protein
VSTAAANDNDDVLDVPGACKLLRMGKNTIYEACASGQMPHRRIGNRIRFSRTALLRWLDSCGGAVAHERQ